MPDHNCGPMPDRSDSKPVTDLMLTMTGQLKVLDFELARIETPGTATQLTVARRMVGTAAHMSPEQAAGESVDARSDLWSLGVVTYELDGRRHERDAGGP